MVKINNLRMNIVSLLLFLGVSLLSAFLQFIIHNELYLNVNLGHLIILLLFPFLHESLHYLGFMIFGRLKSKEILIKSNILLLPYCRNLKEIPIKMYINTMILPTAVTLLFLIPYIFISKNILSSFVIAFLLSAGTGDYFLIISLIKIKSNTLVKSNPSVFGLEIIEND